MNAATHQTLIAIMNQSGKPVPFEIWENGTEVFGFIDKEGLHFFSSEEMRDCQLAK